MSAPSDVGAVEELGRDLSRLLGDGALPPEAEEALRSLIALSRRLASDKAGMAATIAAQEGADRRARGTGRRAHRPDRPAAARPVRLALGTARRRRGRFRRR